MLLLGNQFVRFFKAALLLKLSVAFFYFGYRNAVSDESDGPARAAAAKCAPPTATSAALRQKIDSRVEEELARLARNKETIGYAKASSNKQDAGPIFPRTARNFAGESLTSSILIAALRYRRASRPSCIVHGRASRCSSGENGGIAGNV